MSSKPPRDSTGKRALPIVGKLAAQPVDMASAAAVDRLLEGDSATIIDALKVHLDNEPADEQAWLRLGMAYMSIEHWGLAMSALKNAVEIDGNNIDARLWYARVLARLRRPDHAAFQLLQAKRLAPDDVRVAKQLGIAFYDRSRFDKALVELGRARELDPNDAQTSYALGLCREAKGELAAAIAAYRNAVRLDTAFIDARMTLADALAAGGEIAAAVAQLEQTVRLDSSHAQATINLDVLRKALSALEAERLLGKELAALDESALVQEGQLLCTGAASESSTCYTNDNAELWITLHDGAMTQLALMLRDPAAAAERADDVYRVHIVSDAGEERTVDYATAISLTFLREALGCPMTRAAELYDRLLRTQEAQQWGGAVVQWITLAATSTPALAVTLPAE